MVAVYRLQNMLRLDLRNTSSVFLHHMLGPFRIFPHTFANEYFCTVRLMETSPLPCHQEPVLVFLPPFIVNRLVP